MSLTRAPGWAILGIAATFLSACATPPQHSASPPEPNTSTLAAPETSGPPPSNDVAACSPAQLTLARAGNDAGMGHRAFAFRYTNISQTACTLGAYAQLQPLDENDAVVSAIPVTQATAAYLVPTTSAGTHVLAPGQSLWFVITWSVIPRGAAPCPGMAAIRIAPPGVALPGTPAGPPASAASVDADTPVATDDGTAQVLPQVSSVCDGIHVLPLRAAPDKP